jgi:hypothetical protein
MLRKAKTEADSRRNNLKYRACIVLQKKLEEKKSFTGRDFVRIPE